MLQKLSVGLALILWLTACGMMASAPLPEQPTALPTLTPAVALPQDAAVTEVPALGGKSSGDFLVWLYSTPNPPVRGTNTLEVQVTDANGQPVTDAALSFDVDMTNMSHGKNVVTATALGEGRYSGEVHFLMPGPWRVIVGIEQAGQTSSVRFDFMVSR